MSNYTTQLDVLKAVVAGDGNSDAINVNATVSSSTLPTGAATSANQLTEISSLASVDTKLSSQATAANQTSTNTKLDTLHGDVDGLETLVTSTNTKLDTEITSLQILDDVPTAEGASISKGAPIMGQLDDSGTTAAIEDRASIARITAQRALHTNLRNNAGAETGTSSTPFRVDPTGTTTQPVSVPSTFATGTMTSGSGDVDFSCIGFGNVKAFISGTWTGTINFQASIDGSTFVGIPANSVDLVALDNQVPLSTSSGGTFDFPVSGFKTLRLNNTVVSGTASIALGGGLTTHVLSAILAQVYSAQSGSWTVTADAGTNLNTSALALDASVAGLSLAQNANTAAQKAVLSQGAVTTSAPSYTTAKSNPLSLDISGNLRVSLADTAANSIAVKVNGSAVTQPASLASGSVSSGAFSSGAIASGALASGSIASGAFASGSISAGAIVAGASSFVKLEDSVAADLDAGVPAMAVRKVTPGNTSGTDGDYEMLQMSVGRLWTSSNVDQINSVTPLMGNGITGTGSLRVTVASDNTAFSTNSTLQTGSNQIGHLEANQSANIAQINGVTPLMGNGTTGTGSHRVTIASDNTAFSVNATPPTLTKGTQGSTGYSVQRLQDAGRTHINFYASGIASGTTGTETAITMTKSSGTAATSSAVSFVVTNGKTYRITSLTFGTRGNATGTAEITTFSLRINTGGAVITSSTPITLSVRSGAAATALAYDRISLDVSDGYEIVGDGTLQFGITANSVFTTNAPTWDVLLTGYEY